MWSNLTILTFHSPKGLTSVRLPVVDLTCHFCGQVFTKRDLHDPDVTVSRVGGNSANGYEAYHASCLDDHIAYLDSLDEEIPDGFEVDAEEEEDILRCERDLAGDLNGCCQTRLDSHGHCPNEQNHS